MQKPTDHKIVHNLAPHYFSDLTSYQSPFSSLCSSHIIFLAILQTCQLNSYLIFFFFVAFVLSSAWMHSPDFLIAHTLSFLPALCPNVTLLEKSSLSSHLIILHLVDISPSIHLVMNEQVTEQRIQCIGVIF